MKSPFLFVDQVDVAGKTVLLRLDLNVPIKDGVITDDTRLQRVLDGIVDLRKAGAAIVILTHFGRPKGKIMAEFSVVPVAARLAELLDCAVTVEADVTGAGAVAAVGAMSAGDVLMLENLRFYPGEEGNEQAFAASLAGLGDVYVGDAFSCAHRAHASVEALPRLNRRTRALHVLLARGHRSV